MIFGLSIYQAWQFVRPAASDVAKFAIGSAIPFVGLYFTYRKQKEHELRRSEVHKWADEVIYVMRKLVTVCELQERHFGDEEVSKALNEVTYAATALVDRGRLFFRNDVVNSWGEDHPQAYRGYRTTILDPVLISFKIACNFKSADPIERVQMSLVANDCVREFVSLAQKEVGRRRTASDETGRAGKAPSLRDLMEKKRSSVDKVVQRPRPYII